MVLDGAFHKTYGRRSLGNVPEKFMKTVCVQYLG